ncbi:anti-sigma factor domain-containing protein [Flavobacterium sp. HSC-61S13]|uniref:anti-sigma factor n=1 Tax=Flavobacterium sp. HSC-61S13 TaxID=2910963 RepID=UPI00209EE465|nr:anti-sigma factor [Flavobacterium sp. HSC-61S13]MCP1994589.1 anti-sigma-K factor RskA [Flavobacterium sp. HSC-61S13]
MNSKEYISSGIIELYILGLASVEEAGILECVMKNNTEVRAAFEETQKIMEDLATAQAIAPPVELKAKIWDKINQENKLDKPVSSDWIYTKDLKSDEIQIDNPIATVVKTTNWKHFAVAASVLFLISTVGNVFWFASQKNKRDELAKLEFENETQSLALQKIQQKWNLVSSTKMQTIALNGVEKHADLKAMVFWNKESKEVYLTAENLPAAPEGMQYQLWAIADGKPVSVGMYTYEIDSEVPLSKISNAQAFAITLEKVGGVESPTMENMYVLGNV